LPSVTWIGVSFGAVSRARGASALERSRYQAETEVSHATFSPPIVAGSAEPIGHWLLLPDGAPAWSGDRIALWTCAAQAEKRYDAQEARFLDVTWPRQLPLTHVAEAVDLIYGRFRDAGLAVQVDLHIKEARDGLPNPHLHGLISTRLLGRDGFRAYKFRELSDWFHNAGGRAARRHVADALNEIAARHCHSIVFDSRSNAARGLPIAEDRLPRSYIRRPDTIAARDLLARQDQQRQERHDYWVTHDGLAAAELKVASLERTRRADLDALPCAMSPQASNTPALDRAEWETWRLSLPGISLTPPVSLDTDGYALPVGGRAIIDGGDTIRIEGELDNAAGIVLLALADRKGWTRMQFQAETPPNWFEPGQSSISREATPSPALSPLSWEGVGKVVAAWREPPRRSRRRSSRATDLSSRVAVDLRQRLAVARLPGAGEPDKEDVLGLMQEAVRDQPPGVAHWELWKARLDLAMTAVLDFRKRKPRRKPDPAPTQDLPPRIEGPAEKDLSTELKFF